MTTKPVIYQSYAEQLKRPQWQRKRLEILSRDEFKCRHCMDGDSTLDVHHCFYSKGKLPWEYDNSYLVTLCRDCHMQMRPTIEILSTKAGQNYEEGRILLAQCLAWNPADGAIPENVRHAFRNARFMMALLADLTTVVKTDRELTTKADGSDLLEKLKIEMDQILEHTARHIESMNLSEI